MKTLRTSTLFIAACLLFGCQAQPHSSLASTGQRDAAVGDAQQFATILDYYRKTFPNALFPDGRMVHPADGPNGERVHIDVPVAIDAEYQHSYAPAFLSEQSKSSDGLTRAVADNLLLLRKERLFTYHSRAGYGGATVDCTAYVVKVGQSK